MTHEWRIFIKEHGKGLPGNNPLEISDGLQGQVHVQLDHVASVDKKDVKHLDAITFFKY